MSDRPLIQQVDQSIYRSKADSLDPNFQANEYMTTVMTDKPHLHPHNQSSVSNHTTRVDGDDDSSFFENHTFLFLGIGTFLLIMIGILMYYLN